MVNVILTARGARGFGLGIDRWTGRLQNMHPAFEAIADFQAQEWQKQFATQGAHMSGRWAPLSAPYAAWKAVHFPGRPILVRTGRLRQSLTHRPFGVEEFSKNQVRLGTNVPYAMYHQRGTAFMPRRQIYPTVRTARQTKAIVKVMQRYIVEGRTG